MDNEWKYSGKTESGLDFKCRIQKVEGQERLFIMYDTGNITLKEDFLVEKIKFCNALIDCLKM